MPIVNRFGNAKSQHSSFRQAQLIAVLIVSLLIGLLMMQIIASTATAAPLGTDPSLACFTESFETTPGGSYALITAFDDGGFDFFGRYMVPDASNAARDDFTTGWDGNYGILGQDHDGDGGPATTVISMTAIDVSGATTAIKTVVSLGGLASEPAFQNYESADGDGIEIYATLDGGTRTLIGAFAPPASGAGDLYHDTDLDGIGDGANLTTTLTDFAFDITGLGNSLTLEIEMTSTSGFEAIAVDNVRVLCGSQSAIVINEADADMAGDETTEFIELYDGGIGNTALDGLAVVLYNGSDDQSYEPVFDLDGFSTDANGYFVIGGVGITPTADITVTSLFWLQNGADGIALVTGDGSSFPNDTPVSTTGIVDALVYDTNDSDDSGLLPLLNAGQPQVNEDGNGNKDGHSNQRCPNGSGGNRNTDTYDQHPPTPGEANTCTVVAPTVTLIHDIQGSGDTVTGPGPFIVNAIVIGDYQGVAGTNDDNLDGFVIQEEDADADADAATSEGIFVFCSSCPTDVSVGDLVTVTGTASDFQDMSQLTATDAGDVVVSSTGNTLPTAVALTLPVPGVTATDLAGAQAQINAYYEAFEGMLVTFPGSLTVSEYFEQARFGHVLMTQGGRIRQYTDANPPSVAGLEAHNIDLARRSIFLDDDSNEQNHPLFSTPELPIYYPQPGLSITNYFRGGDTIDDMTGVLHWSWPGFGANTWRIRPSAAANTFTEVNPRPASTSSGWGHAQSCQLQRAELLHHNRRGQRNLRAV